MKFKRIDGVTLQDMTVVGEGVAQRLIAAEAKLADAKKIYDDYDIAVIEAIGQFGLGTMFEHAGVVYELIEPKGRFVEYKRHAVIRTRKPGEVKGDLSESRAKEAGFNPVTK